MEVPTLTNHDHGIFPATSTSLPTLAVMDVFVPGGRNMTSVEDLDVFKLAHQLALKTYAVTKKFPKEETFSLVDQMRRAQQRRRIRRREKLLRVVLKTNTS